MNQRGIIDVVCKTAVTNLATEIGALLGRELTCDNIQLQLLSKDAIFSDLERPPTALTQMTISGDKEGECYMLTRIASSIVLGGTLIMLPEEMIEEQIQSGELDGELIDAFGEVANIIAGVFTQAFVDKYSKTIRFIKKTVEELASVTKIDPAGDSPFPPGTYYVTSCELVDGDKNLGPIEFIVPAAAFELDEGKAEDPEPVPEPEVAAAEATQEQPGMSEAAAEPEPAAAEREVAAREEAPPPAPRPAFADAKKLTDVVFNATISQIGEEIGALVGQELKCDDVKLLLLSKADFFAEHCTDKVNMALMKVSGAREGCGFMFTQVKDAIILGGTLIMLPEDQIEEQVGRKSLEGEVEDAYGEVANILAGGLTQVFLDRYPQKLRFVRTESSLVTPTQIDMASDDPFPEGDYYLASFAISMEGYQLDRILLLFPAQLFQLDGYQQQQASAAETDSAEAISAQPIETGAADQAQKTTEPFAPAAAGPSSGQVAATAPSGPPLVLVIAEDPGSGQTFADNLSSAGYQCRLLSFQDDIKTTLREAQVLGAILIMSKVNEKGFAAAIKLQSTGQKLPPLIFAGPEWTRSTVLRAVRYGAQDILITPASGDEIEEKISQHFRKAS